MRTSRATTSSRGEMRMSPGMVSARSNSRLTGGMGWGEDFTRGILPRYTFHVEHVLCTVVTCNVLSGCYNRSLCPENTFPQQQFEPLALAERLHQQAGQLLADLRLAEIIAPYGAITPTGSYYLNVMVYPDIDIYLPKLSHRAALLGRRAACPGGGDCAGGLRAERPHDAGWAVLKAAHSQ